MSHRVPSPTPTGTGLSVTAGSGLNSPPSVAWRAPYGLPGYNWKWLYTMSSTLGAIGCGTTDTGGIADGTDATGPAISYGSATSGQNSGESNVSTATSRYIWESRWGTCTYYLAIKTGSTVATSTLYWMGMSEYSTTSANAATPNTAGTYRQMASCRFLSGTDTNWTFYTASASNFSTVDTGVVVTADTEYLFRFTFSATSYSVEISLNAGTTWSTAVTLSTALGSNIPVSSTPLQWQFNVIPQTASNRTFRFRGCSLFW